MALFAVPLWSQTLVLRTLVSLQTEQDQVGVLRRLLGEGGVCCLLSDAVSSSVQRSAGLDTGGVTGQHVLGQAEKYSSWIGIKSDGETKTGQERLAQSGRRISGAAEMACRLCMRDGCTLVELCNSPALQLGGFFSRLPRRSERHSSASVDMWIWMNVCCCCEVIANGVPKQRMMAVVCSRAGARKPQSKQDLCVWRKGRPKSEQGKQINSWLSNFRGCIQRGLKRLGDTRLTCRRRWRKEDADRRVAESDRWSRSLDAALAPHLRYHSILCKVSDTLQACIASTLTTRALASMRSCNAFPHEEC